MQEKKAVDFQFNLLRKFLLDIVIDDKIASGTRLLLTPVDNVFIYKRPLEDYELCVCRLGAGYVRVGHRKEYGMAIIT